MPAVSVAGICFYKKVEDLPEQSVGGWDDAQYRDTKEHQQDEERAEPARNKIRGNAKGIQFQA